MPFSSLVDPHGILAGAIEDDEQFVHTLENQVEYYQLVNDGMQAIR